jgi:hypothetical protein
MMRNGIAYRLPPLVPRISGTGCSFWRTPTPTEAGNDVTTLRTKNGAPAKIGERAYRPDGTLQGQTLSQQVRFPTATAGDSKSARNATANRSGEAKKQNSGTTLTDFVTMWPTPDAYSNRGGAQSPEKRKAGGHLVNLQDAAGGQLNPQFVEYLKGFPKHWTEVD